MRDEIFFENIDKYNKKIKNSLVLGITWLVLALFFVDKIGFAYKTEGDIRLLLYVFSIFSLLKSWLLIRKKRKAEKKREQKKREQKKREQKKREEELAKEKKEREKREKIEKYEIERQEIEKKYFEYFIANPNALLLYKEIMSKGRDYNSIHKNSFKSLFWDFLIGISNKENKFEVYKSKLLLLIEERIKYIPIYKNGIIEFKSLDYYFGSQNFFEEIVSFFKYNFILISSSEIKEANSRLDILLKSINNFKMLFQFFEQYYENTVKEFEKNADLMKIYNNLKKEKFDKEYIQEKIYYLYENLYVSNNVKLSKEDIQLIIDLEDNIYEMKNFNNQTDSIKSKKQLIEIISNEYNNLDERKMIIWIAHILQTQKDINMSLKVDIIKNIDDILEEIMSRIEANNAERENNKRKELAQKERDRLLNGDFKKERKKSKIKNKKITSYGVGDYE